MHEKVENCIYVKVLRNVFIYLFIHLFCLLVSYGLFFVPINIKIDTGNNIKVS